MSDQRILDARPDRIDYRDREYQPLLKSLPERFPDPDEAKQLLPAYRDLILNQGTEGACTGFGLAAVINFLLWMQSKEVKHVSTRMLYHMARLYDEWLLKAATGISR